MGINIKVLVVADQAFTSNMVSMKFVNEILTFYYLAQKLCFWKGIILIRVYVSVCV